MTKTTVMMVMLAAALPFRAPQLQAQTMHPSIPCPVLLVSGHATRDSIELSFMNRGKMPIQQLSVHCTPPMAGQARGSICHTESGLFYPGQRYTTQFSYTGAMRGVSHGPVTLTVQGARLGDGELWTPRSARVCRPLTVPRRK